MTQKNSQPIILIIGGTGRMGQWFKNFFASHSLTVLIHGRKSREKLVSLIKKADIIMVAVPISQSEMIIKRVIPSLTKDQLLVDISSLKKLPMEAMKEATSGTLGLHPLFGPSVIEPNGQKIVVCRQKNNHHITFLLSLFRKSGLEVIEMTPENHDRQMALIQGLTHAINILFAKTLKSSEIILDERLQTPLFKLQTLVMQRVLQQDPQLMEDIQILNPHFLSILNELINNSTYLKEIQNQPDMLSELLLQLHEENSSNAALALHQTGKILQMIEKKSYNSSIMQNTTNKKISSISYLGPDGTNTQQAAISLASKSTKMINQTTLGDIFTAVENGEAQLGVVPAENSIHGTVRETFDLLSESSVQTIGSFDLPIYHALLSLETDLKKINRVISHPQALAQSKSWLQANLPHAQLVLATSTTSALANPKRGEGYIAASIASGIYNIPLVAQNIEDVKTNSTRFYAIAKCDTEVGTLRRENTLLLLSIYNRVGILRDILDIFASNKISLNKLESRPSLEKIWDYCFYVEVDHSPESLELQKALDKLREVCSSIRILGRT